MIHESDFCHMQSRPKESFQVFHLASKDLSVRHGLKSVMTLKFTQHMNPGVSDAKKWECSVIMVFRRWA